MLGTSKLVTVSKDDTLVLDGAGDKAKIDERCETLRGSIEETSSTYEAEKLNERLVSFGLSL